MSVIDHIGVAVRSIEERLELYRVLGLEAAGGEEVPSQGVRVCFLPVEGTRLELLEPTKPESPLARHIESRGEGLHHLAFRVDDIERAMAELRENGFRLLSEMPQLGAHGSRVCFIHPKSAGGVLIELCQPAVRTVP